MFRGLWEKGKSARNEISRISKLQKESGDFSFLERDERKPEQGKSKSSEKEIFFIMNVSASDEK